MLLPQGGQQRGLVLGRYHQEQPPRGLGIHTEISIGWTQLRIPLHPIGGIEVSLSTSREDAARCKISGVRENRKGGERNLSRHLARLQYPREMADQSKAGDIGGGTHPDFESRSSGPVIQRHHGARRL